MGRSDVIDRLLLFFATLSVAGAYVPQIWKAYQTQSTGDLSWGMLVIMMLGIVLWTAYGLRKKDHQFVLSNIIIFVFVSVLAILKFRYG